MSMDEYARPGEVFCCECGSKIEYEEDVFYDDENRPYGACCLEFIPKPYPDEED